MRRLSNLMIRKGLWLYLAVVPSIGLIHAQSGTFLRHDIQIGASWQNRDDCVAGPYVRDGFVTSTSTSASTTIQLPPLNCPGVHGGTFTWSVALVMPATMPPILDMGKTPVAASLTATARYAGTDPYSTTKAVEAFASVPTSSSQLCPHQHIIDTPESAAVSGSYSITATAAATCDHLSVPGAQSPGSASWTSFATFQFGSKDWYGAGISVNITSVYVYGPDPTLQLTPPGMTISQPAGSLDYTPTPVTVKNSGGGTLNWQATPSADWIGISKTSGSLAAGQSDTLSAKVDFSKLTVGSHPGDITFTGNAANSPQKFTVTATATPPLPDVLTLTSLTPDPSKPLAAGTKQDFTAQVSYTVGTQGFGRILLSALSGARYDSSILQVEKGSGNVTLKLSQFPIPDDASSVSVQVELDPPGAGPALKQVTTDYKVVGTDSIAFGTGANSVFPAPRETIVAGKSPLFFAAVDYSLGTMDRGEVYLQLTTGKGTGLAWSAQHANVKRGKDWAILVIDSFALDTAIALLGEDVQELDLKAYLSDGTGNVLAVTGPVQYKYSPAPQFTLQFGYCSVMCRSSNDWVATVPAGDLIVSHRGNAHIRFDHKPFDGTMAGVLLQYKNVIPGSTQEVLVTGEENDQASLAYSPLLQVFSSENTVVFITERMTYPTYPINKVNFRVRCTGPDGQQVLSDARFVPYEGIWIDRDNMNPYDPDKDGAPPLTACKTYEFVIRGKVTAWAVLAATWAVVPAAVGK